MIIFQKIFGHKYIQKIASKMALSRSLMSPSSIPNTLIQDLPCKILLIRFSSSEVDIKPSLLNRDK